MGLSSVVHLPGPGNFIEIVLHGVQHLFHPPVLLPEVLTPGIVFSALDGIKAGPARAGTGL